MILDRFYPNVLFLVCIALVCRSVAAGECSPWDASAGQPGMNSTVWALATGMNGDLVAGGGFTMAGGIVANRVARWDGAQWHALGDGVNGAVTTLVAMPNGDIVAGGTFTMAGDVPANRIARWDGNQWHAMGDGFAGGAVWSVALMPGSGDIVAGGSFTLSGGTIVNRIARFDGTQWHAMSSGMNAAVRTLAVFDAGNGPTLYAGGDFVTAGGAVVNYIAKWDGEAWLPLDSGVNGVVTHLAAHDDGNGSMLHIAGSFHRAGPIEMFGNMGKWDGHYWHPFSGGLSGSVQAMAVFDLGDGPALYAAGSLTINGESAGSLAKWDGRWWRFIAPPTDGVVFALALAGEGTSTESLYFGGNFTEAAGEAVGRVVRWQACPAPTVTLHVPGQYGTIQGAIDAAEDGDKVLVAPGTYMEKIDFLGKAITVESEQGAEVTIIDATGLLPPAVTVQDAGAGTTLRGLTITGGESDVMFSRGGGLFVSDSMMEVDSCIFIDNRSYAGGGINVSGGHTLIINCLFMHNQAEVGGGVAVSTTQLARVHECTFLTNSAFNGGGINLNIAAKAVVTRCTFQDNTFVGDSSYSFGGGAFVWFETAGMPSATAVFDECDFLGNSAGLGGGGGLAANELTTIRRCLFDGNTADMGSALRSDDTLVLESVISNNFGADHGAVLGITHVAGTHFCNNKPDHFHNPELHYIDLGGNTFEDQCDGPLGDLNGDGVVDVSDLLILLAAWGDCPRGLSCSADFSGDGAVDVSDLLILLSNWS